MSTYRIVRLHRDNSRRSVLRRGLTLDEAHAHCRDPETSASTCEEEEAKEYTERHGAWFDAYEEERGQEKNMSSIHERETERLERQRQALVEYFQQATPGSCSLDWLNIEETHEKILCNSIWDEIRESREQREADEFRGYVERQYQG